MCTLVLSPCSFDGCLQNLVINNPVDLQDHVTSVFGNDPPVPTPGCPREDTCQGEPCHNGGVCRPQWGGYSCSCAAGFQGENCTEGTNPAVVYYIPSEYVFVILDVLFPAIYVCCHLKVQSDFFSFCCSNGCDVWRFHKSRATAGGPHQVRVRQHGQRPVPHSCCHVFAAAAAVRVAERRPRQVCGNPTVPGPPTGLLQLQSKWESYRNRSCSLYFPIKKIKQIKR